MKELCRSKGGTGRASRQDSAKVNGYASFALITSLVNASHDHESPVVFGCQLFTTPRDTEVLNVFETLQWHRKMTRVELSSAVLIAPHGHSSTYIFDHVRNFANTTCLQFKVDYTEQHESNTVRSSSHSGRTAKWTGKFNASLEASGFWAALSIPQSISQASSHDALLTSVIV